MLCTCLRIILKQTCNNCNQSISLVAKEAIDSYYEEIINGTLRPRKKTVVSKKTELCLASAITPFIRFQTIKQILDKNILYFILYSAQERVKQYPQIDLCSSWEHAGFQMANVSAIQNEDCKSSFLVKKSVSRIEKSWFITGFQIHFIGTILLNFNLS